MRHGSLHSDVLVMSEKIHILLSNIKQDILGRKIKVKKIISNQYFQKFK